MIIGKHLTRQTHVFCGYDKHTQKLVSDLIQSHAYKELCEVRTHYRIELIPPIYHLRY